MLRMRRLLLTTAALGAGVLLFAGCSKTDSTATTTASTQAEAKSGSKTNPSTTENTTSGGASDSTMPTVPGNIPGANDVNKTLADGQKCMDLSLAYAGIYGPLISGSANDAQKAEIAQKLAEMKRQVPDGIRKDLDTIEAGIKNSNGMMELGEFMSSSEYTRANESVQNYLDKECANVGK